MFLSSNSATGCDVATSTAGKVIDCEAAMSADEVAGCVIAISATADRGCNVSPDAGGVAHRRGDQLQRIAAHAVGPIVPGDQIVGGIYPAVAVVIVMVVDCRRRKAGLVRARAHFVLRINHGIGRIVARLADGIAEVKYVRGGQPGVGVGQDRHLQPLVLDGIVVQMMVTRSEPSAPVPWLTLRRLVGAGAVVQLPPLPT